MSIFFFLVYRPSLQSVTGGWLGLKKSQKQRDVLLDNPIFLPRKAFENFLGQRYFISHSPMQAGRHARMYALTHTYKQTRTLTCTRTILSSVAVSHPVDCTTGFFPLAKKYINNGCQHSPNGNRKYFLFLQCKTPQRYTSVIMRGVLVS